MYCCSLGTKNAYHIHKIPRDLAKISDCSRHGVLLDYMANRMPVATKNNG